MPCANGRTCACSPPGLTMSTRRRRRCCVRRAGTARSPTAIRRVASLSTHYLEPLGIAHEARASTSRPARGSFPGTRRVRQGQDGGSGERALRNPLSERQGTLDVACRCSDRRLGNLEHAQPAGANGLEAIGETAHAARIAYGMPDVLGGQRSRYAKRSWPCSVPGIPRSAPFSILRSSKGMSHQLRSSGFCAGHPGKVLRRRRQRQTFRAWRTRQGVRPTCSRRRRSSGNRLPAHSHHIDGDK